MNLAICIPARDMVHAGFAHDLSLLTAQFYASAPPGAQMNVHMISGTLISDQRTNLVKMSLEGGADWILFLDSDMRFPRQLADRLLSHGQDIVACNYATRRFPVRTVAFKPLERFENVFSAGKTGLEEVDAVGMGAMLIRAEVFRKLPQPWFHVSWLPNAQIYMGEDMYFCKLAQKHGFKVMVDHDLSQTVRHIGLFEFAHDHVERQSG